MGELVQCNWQVRAGVSWNHQVGYRTDVLLGLREREREKGTRHVNTSLESPICPPPSKRGCDDEYTT